MLRRAVLLTTTFAALAPAGALFATSSASAATVSQATSANWAGYVASSASSSGFSRASGSWVEPSADSSAGDGYSAFWVGLGGSDQSQSLEQIGTQADVNNGQPAYYAWYELVPAAQVRIPVAIHPGDHLSASVSVSGTSVTVSLSDQTTGQSYTNTLQMSTPDTSTAEWIAEAPSASDGTGNLQTLPLSDFGTANFTSSTATADGHTGSIVDPSWSSEAVQLNGQDGAGATPSGLSSDGSSFSVAWQGSSQGATSPAGYQYGYGGYAPDAYGGYGPYGYDQPPAYFYGY